MKYLFILSLFIVSCNDKIPEQTEEGKANWRFVGCMNTKKVINKCKKIEDWDNKVECMSAACGRPNIGWKRVDPRTFNGPF